MEDVVTGDAGDDSHRLRPMRGRDPEERHRAATQRGTTVPLMAPASLPATGAK